MVKEYTTKELEEMSARVKEGSSNLRVGGWRNGNT